MDNRQLLAYYLPEWVQVIETLGTMTPAEIVTLALAMGLSASFTALVFKNLLLWALRFFGLYNPQMYRYLPSTLPYWRMLYRLFMRFSNWREFFKRNQPHETGGFAGSFATMTRLLPPSGILLGRVWFKGFGLLQPVGIDIQRHLMVYAMSGAGKTTWLITMLSLWRGSAWLIDPKGQITHALQTNERRDWVVFNPYSPENTAQWNPLDDIHFAIAREGHEAAVKWAVRLGQSLIVTPANSKQPFFSDTARGYFIALVLHVMSKHPQNQHNLAYIRELIVHGYRVYNEDGSLESSSEEARELLDQQLLQNPHFEGAISAQASAFINASGDTKSSLIATLQEQTKWLDFPTVRHMLTQTTRPLSEAKTRDDIVLSFVVPVLSLREELQPLLRAFTNFTTYTFEAVKHKKGQCLCIIDEVQAQGYNQTLEIALPVARSYGQSIVAIAQDIEGMKAAYPKTYRSFEGNADAVLFMASNHPDNLKHISDVLGKRSWVKRDPRTGQEAQRWTASVMSAEQVKRFLSPHHGNLIAVLAGGRALKLKIANYFHELPVTRYQADPDHKEPLRKRFPRFLLNFPKFRARRPDTGGKANARHANSAAPYSTQQRNHTGEP